MGNMVSLELLLAETGAEIERLKCQRRAIEAVRLFVLDLQDQGLGVDVAHYGGFDFTITVAEILDREEAAAPVAAPDHAMVHGAIADVDAPFHGTASAEFHGTDAAAEVFGDAAERAAVAEAELGADFGPDLGPVLIEREPPADRLQPVVIPADLPAETGGLANAAAAPVDQVAGHLEHARATGEGSAGDVGCLTNSPESIATPPAGQAPVEPKQALPARWTAEEDEVAVRLKLDGVPVAAIARRLGRPVEGTSYRLYHALKSRWHGLAVTLAAPKAAAKKADIKASGKAADKAPPLSTAPAAPVPMFRTKALPVQPDPDLSLAAHCARLSPDPAWPLARDVEMLGLTVDLRWPMSDIALELGVTSVDLKARFDLLCGKERGQKPRYLAADVLAELRGLLMRAEQAGAA